MILASVLTILVPVLLCAALFTLAERQMMALVNNRYLTLALGCLCLFKLVILTGFFYYNYQTSFDLLFTVLYCSIGVLPFSTPHVRGDKRIGPHDQYIDGIIIGGLLGDAYALRRSVGTTIYFGQSASLDHLEYLIKLWEVVFSLGYCSDNKPKPMPYANGTKVRCRFNTFTYSSFNYYYDLFYVNGVKVIPYNIVELLSPLAVAIWVIDDGSLRSKSALKICTHYFSYADVFRLCVALSQLYGINCYPMFDKYGSNGMPQYFIYIPAASMRILRGIISPYFPSGMLKKLGI